MSYMQDLEARLKTLLSGMPDEEAAILIREMKAIALESYRNGQQAHAAPRAHANPAAKHYKH